MQDKPTAPSDLILELRDLCVDARSPDGRVPILKGVRLRLRPGEVVGLIGESGSGKSTLGLAAMAFARPGCRIASGEVFYRGRNLLKLSERDRRQVRGSQIGYVAQSAAASFNPVRRILNQAVEVPMTHKNLSRKEAAHAVIGLFSQLQLPEPLKIGLRYPHEVSGGQLQRAMTAMAMAPAPDIIVFDEPTTALDVTTQVEVLAAIRRVVRRAGTAAIYISHDLAVVAQMADRIMVLRNGLIVEEGETEDVLNRPQQVYTAALVSQRKRPPRPLRGQSDELLRCENLGHSYGRTPVLADVTLSVHEGETVAVVGESGSGKTTLGRVIAGLLPQASGKLFWRGAPLQFDYRQRINEQLRRIQFVYQSPDSALNPRHTVGEILARPIQFYLNGSGAECDDHAKKLLRMVELDPDQLLHRFPSQLSGGQQQRLCIARALAAQPHLLICDEVTSALDPLVSEGILKLLMQLQKDLGVAYLFITHDMATVQAIADRVAVMSNGVVVDQGPRNDVLRPPRHAYTKKLLSSTPELATDWLDRLLAERDRPDNVAVLERKSAS